MKRKKEMKNKKRDEKNALMLIVVLALSFFAMVLIGISSVEGEEISWPAYNTCCEKTKSGAWCQNTLEENCDIGNDLLTNSPLRKTPTSCDATSFCKTGCCVDSDEGLCMRNTPQRVCEVSSGTWFDDNQCNIPQCNLGCCLIGDQASFVTLTRCKKMSNFYGLSTNFKKNINNEMDCIRLAFLQDKGACVYEIEGEKTCRFTTRAECTDAKKSGNLSVKGEFHKDYLCSADELGTNCGPTTETMCVQGKDEVYFKDSCGNPANIYDSNRIYAKDPGYWKKVALKIESCGGGKNANINSRTCGNCKYLEGSLCGKGNAVYGNYVCKDLNCYNTQNGKSYKNGESWCEYQSEVGNGQDKPGSRHFRHVCVQGEETVEPCADFRNEICIEEKIEGADFIEAACRVNRWKDCIDQHDEENCLNKDKRDCYWKEGYHFFDGKGRDNLTNTEKATEGNVGDESNPDRNAGILKGGGICLASYPPGLKFWEGSDAKSVCSLGNSRQTVHFSTNIFGTKKCTKNCEVLEASWANKMNDICTNMGDCGAKENFIGKYTNEGVVWKVNGKLKEIPELGIGAGKIGKSGNN